MKRSICADVSRKNVPDDPAGTADASSKGHCENGLFPSLRTLPSGIFAVSFFGLFLGISTTMVYSQLGMFLKNELNASEAVVGFIDGVVEFIAFVCRVGSGILSDYLSERKLILYIGCSLTLIARPLFAMAATPLMVVLTQSLERLGNGFQATPRDALIADLSREAERGRSYGFSRSLKTIGSFLGTPVAILIMYLSCDNYRTVFFCATIPVVISFFCLMKVKTPRDLVHKAEETERKIHNPFRRRYLKSLDLVFWKILILAFLFEMGHFAESLLPIYGSNFLSKTTSGAVSMFISTGQVCCSFPIGLYADRFGRGRFIKVCMIMMILANVCFLSASSIAFVYAGAFLWGGQMTAVQGLFLSIICGKVDEHLRATAIGVYYLTIGSAYFISSMLAGQIWTTWGSDYAFMYSIFFSCLGLITFRMFIPKKYEYADRSR
ncbi:MAG: MFS transporter [Holosporaceae bacterium]|jgi:MFS family permease|nr:MFS transporter [Holosporaceae bacterium]